MVAVIPKGTLTSVDKHPALIEDFRAIADDVGSVLILDLNEILLNDLNASHSSKDDVLFFFSLLDPLWSRLRERGRQLVLLVQPDRRWFRYTEWALRCTISTTAAEALAAAGNLLDAVKIDELTQIGLMVIQRRFERLVRERIPCYRDSPEETPNIARLFATGTSSGVIPFPYGCLQWRVVGTEPDLRVEYEDSCRVAEGWGCKFELTPDETRLIESGLD